MPTRNGFHVIQGGKPAGAEPSGEHGAADLAPLLARTNGYRQLLLERPSEELSGLVNDMEEAIKALQRLERSSHPEAGSRAAEYRRLIDEIDAEILAALKDG